MYKKCLCGDIPELKNMKMVHMHYYVSIVIQLQ